MRIFLYTFFFSIIFLNSAFAGTSKCSVPSYVSQDTRAAIMANSECICADAAKNYPYKIPSHFQIVALCGHQNVGPFYFEGKQRVSGYITRMDTMTFGDHVFLEITNAIESDGLLSLFYFSRPDKAVAQLSIPSLTEKAACWKAPVVLDIIKFNLDLDSNDSSGAYLHTYKVISVGKYRRCKVESTD